MAKVDPTGFDKAIASIQPGALSERQQRIAAGLAMIREGKSLSAAARAVQVPLSTMWNYHHGVSTLEGGNQQGGSLSRELEAVHATSHDIALLAGENIVRSLTTEPEVWKPGDLVKAYGVAVDKIAILSQQPQGAQEDGQSLLAKFLSGHRVTIEPKRAGDDAVEVEAERE